MTDEETAEEYAKGLCKTCTVDTCRYNIFQTCAIKESIKQAHLAGLNASRPKWHKVADGDLPNENKRYLCKIKGFVGGGISYECFDYDIEYSSWKNACGDVIEWCEIPTFDKE